MMETTDDHYMEVEETGEENEITVNDDDVSVKLSDETWQHLSISEGPSSGHRKVKVRPKLRCMKSFPPYSQCIGGLGQEKDDEQDGDTQSPPQNSTPYVTHKPCLTPREWRSEEQEALGTERKDMETDAMCKGEELRAKWRGRRRERLGGSNGADMEGWERRQRWSGKRKTGEARGERQHGSKEEEGKDTDGERNHWRSSARVNSGAQGKEAEDDERRGCAYSEMEGEGEGSGKTVRKSQEGEGLLVRREGSMNPWPTPHPILSRLLHSSSSTSTSSSSSMNLSSAESDDVFSEGEDAGSKRKTFRKCHSWKTFVTMMHWSPRQQSSWVQLAGHQGNFQLSDGGKVLKLYSEVEARCLDWLMRDQLRPFVPQYHGLVTSGDHSYIRLDDLLSGLKRPVIMDCKMGVRTYQEEELIKAQTKPILRNDMYQKMVKIDPTAPSAEEHAQKGVTKWRYLQWRDTSSSTATLGFRIEGIMMDNGNVQRDFRKIMTLAQATEALLFFTSHQLHILKAYHARLQALSETLKESSFFRTHEVIGSSLLFVHDHSSKASVWMIDFGKTTPVPDTHQLQHDVPWAKGSREDGYLIGLASLTSSLSQAITLASWQQEESSGGERTGVFTQED